RLRSWCCFFFQAEDGIRDFHVTGVQTCALPISQLSLSGTHVSHPSIVTWVPLNESWGVQHGAHDPAQRHYAIGLANLTRALDPSSEERRVGKERSSRGAAQTAETAEQ